MIDTSILTALYVEIDFAIRKEMSMNRTLDRRHPRALACALALTMAASFARTSSATVLYDATGGSEMGGDISDPNLTGGVGPVLADRFFNPVSARLTSVVLNLALNGPPLSGFTVALWPDSTGTPGLPIFAAEIKIASVSDASLTSGFKLYTFVPVGNIILSPHTFYDIGIDTGTVLGAAPITNVIFGNTVDPAVLGRNSVIMGGFYFHTVGSVDPNSAGPYELIVDAAVPEPSTWALLLAGLVVISYKGRRQVETRSTLVDGVQSGSSN